jgi:hypothetical protein
MTDAAQKEALAAFDAMQKEALVQLGEAKGEHRFEMVGECLDKAGEKTRVLIIDTDRPGSLGLYAERGNPFEPDLTTGKMEEDKESSTAFLRFMANVDIKNDDVLQAVGFTALGQARTAVRNFFMLQRVSEIKRVAATEK